MDLEIYDREALAIAIAQFAIPIITGIGHQKDVSVCDLVAHYACKTPTALAEFILARAQRFEERIDEVMDAIRKTALACIEESKNSLVLLHERISNHVLRKLESERSQLLLLEAQRIGAVKLYLSQKKAELREVELAVQSIDPIRLMQKGYVLALHDKQIVRNLQDLEPLESFVLWQNEHKIEVQKKP